MSQLGRLALVALTIGLVSCTEETVEPLPYDPTQLAPPPAGQGFQVETQEFEVAPGEEIQDCYFFRVGDLAAQNGMDPTQPVNLHRVQIAQRDGSHHMNIFRVKTISNLGPDGGLVQRGLNGQGECFKSPNWSDWPLIANSQQSGNLDWTFPDGVANILQPDEWIMLQTHYVNASTQKTPASAGYVRANLWHIPATEVKDEMGTLFATKQSVRVCQSNPNPTFEGTCQFNSPSPVRVIGANGHFHSRGTQFDMYSWDGTSITTPPSSDMFYASQAWDDPPMLHSPELDLAVPQNGGVWYSCSYAWRQPEQAVGCSGLNDFDKSIYNTPDDQLDCCYTFGPIVEKNEHCNIFVYYYPKQDDINCF